ncbi:MAG: hypothetical protein E7346_01790 [Clostridiales bacterium]|nr:hypothetical protein [Clostridiales bacterium]MBQ3046727.1 DNA integrity scanning protein DisA nucleotide-binding domain protein [Clostridia bacterium]
MNLGERLSAVWNSFTSSPEMTVGMLVSIGVFTVLYYYMIKFLSDNESETMTVLFVMVMVISAVILTFINNINSAIFLIVPAVFIVAILVLYSTEIKRIIWARKHNKMVDVKHDGLSYDEERIQTCIVEIIKALQNMSKNDVGAIIVLSTGNVPGQILDSGVRLDSDISSALIESVFFPKTPLHDGAMVISGTKIVSAGCFLPLSQNDNIPKDLGTRHRAGIGVTETIDVVSLIVSEETGIISVARAGKITRYADIEMLKKTLTKYYWQELESARK